MAERSEAVFDSTELDNAYAALTDPHLGLEALAGKSIYYFPRASRLVAPDASGTAPLSIISSADRDAIVIIGNNDLEKPIQGRCGFIYVINGSPDTGIKANFTYALIEDQNHNLRGRFLYPQKSQDIITAHFAEINSSMLMFGTAAQDMWKQKARHSSVHLDTLAGYRLRSRQITYPPSSTTPHSPQLIH